MRDYFEGYGYLILYLVLVSVIIFGLILNEISKEDENLVREGVVVELNYLEPTSRTVSGGFLSGYVFVPTSRTVNYKEAYEVVVKGLDSEGVEGTSKYYVNSTTFDSLEIGDSISYDSNFMLTSRPRE